MSASTQELLARLDAAQAAYARSASSNGSGQVLGQPWSQDLVRTLSYTVIGFAVTVLLIAGLLLWRSRASPDVVLKTVGLVMILGLSALLLVVGYNNEQLTPIVGLFGAIAGYLLGKDTKPIKRPKGDRPASHKNQPAD